MFLHPSIEQKNSNVVINLNVHPNSPKKSIEMSDDTIEVYVSEPPDKGKANKAILKMFSKQLKIHSSQITLVKGLKSKRKIILIKDVNVEEVFNKLS